jgi:hypothetical protein
VDPRPSRRKLEAEWHQRLKRARSLYEGKVAIRKEMLAERSEWPISLQPDRDGRFALHLALQEESAARKEYMRVLRIFTKLILQGARSPRAELRDGPPGFAALRSSARRTRSRTTGGRGIVLPLFVLTVRGRSTHGAPGYVLVSLRQTRDSI